MLTIIILLQSQTKETDKTEIWFSFQKTKYIYDAEEKKQFQSVQFPVDLPLKEYQSWKGYMEEADVADVKNKYGDNE